MPGVSVEIDQGSNQMSLQKAIEEVFPYQEKYSQSNTPEMKARGELIRFKIPQILEAAVQSGRISNSKVIPDLFIEGSDGKGNKNYVPWVRLASESLSPSARVGWYITFLFSADAEVVWLVIAHASTSEGGKGISKSVRLKLKNWGLGKLPNPLSIDKELSSDVSLGSDGLGLADVFESTSLFGYPLYRGAVPSDEDIFQKINSLLPHLKTLYDAELNDPSMPSAESREIKVAEEVIDEIAGKVPKRRKYSGQGIRGTYKENRAVERRAVEVAIAYFKETSKWETIEDTGDKESFDLLLTNKNKKMYVEVKGTQSSGVNIFLTKNEVSLQKKMFPNKALVVVSEINLIKGEEPKADGGVIKVITPWEILDGHLSAMAFEYLVPNDSY
jgi:hypothetical protein